METKEEKAARLIERHVRDRNMNPASIEEVYRFTHTGIEIDPDFFEARLDLGWGFFKDEPRHLDHITRNMLIFVFLAFRQSVGCFHQGRKAVQMGATYEQMMEALEAAHAAGGGITLHTGSMALQRMKDEGLEPGSQPGPHTNQWVQLGDPERIEKYAQSPLPVPVLPGDLEQVIRDYYSEELGGGQIAEDLVLAARLDPDFWTKYVRLAWGIYTEKPCYLDPVRRELAICVILAFQGRLELLEFHFRRALRFGVTYEQLLEVFETAFVGAGNLPAFSALRVLRKIQASSDATDG